MIIIIIINVIINNKNHVVKELNVLIIYFGKRII